MDEFQNPSTRAHDFVPSEGEGQKKAKSYWRQKHALSLWELAFSVGLLALIQFTGVSTALKTLAINSARNFYFALIPYLAGFGLIYYLATLPFGFYEGYVLEHRFLLSNQTLAGWAKDEAKKCVISFVIFLLMMESLYAIAMSFQANWWVAAAIFWVFISIVFAEIFPVVIIPLFYKYNKLSDNELRNTTFELAGKFGIKLMDVFVIDFSKNTKKANAAIVGWGRTKRVILADNLINEFTPTEVKVVIAHEMAHYKLKHLWKLVFASAASITFFFFVLYRVLPGLAAFFGLTGPLDMAMLPMLYAIFILYELILMPIHNGFSRKLEKDADVMALEITKLSAPFISLMEKLAQKNLSDKFPGRLTEYIFYNHPPISKRIALARKMAL